jgi:hypothetical protein
MAAARFQRNRAGDDSQWGREPNFGLIVVPDPTANAFCKLINELAQAPGVDLQHCQNYAAVGETNAVQR